MLLAMLTPWIPQGRASLLKIAPGYPKHCQEVALWGWVWLISIISVSSLDFGNRVAVVLQEIL